MSRHLADDVLLEIAEDCTRAPGAEEHLGTCEQCRQQVDALRAMLDCAHASDVPEPSPLFWDHLSANVRDEVRNAEFTPSWAGFFVGWRRLAVAAAVVVLCGVVAAWQWGSLRVPQSNRPEVRQQAASIVAAPVVSEVPESEKAADEEWKLVADASAGVDLQSATEEAFSLQPGSAERAATQLSPEEQHELIRLLQTEAVQGPSEP